MNRFIGKIKESFAYAGALRKTHPATFVILVLGTAVYFFRALLYGLLNISAFKPYKGELNDALDHLGLWMVLLFAASFLIEIIIPATKKSIKFSVIAVMALITFIHSGLLVGSFVFENGFEKLSGRIGDERLSMYTTGYLVIVFVLALFFSYQRIASEFTFAEYLMGVISGEFLISVIYTIVMIGVVTLTFVFTELLFGEFEDIFLPVCALVTGLYSVGAGALTIVRSEKETPKFVNVLFRYVLFGMSLVAYVIIYLYIIKITVLSSFPSNSVYSILTFLFCFSMPLAYLNSYLDEGWMGKISRILPIIFAPLLILQSYTVFARIGEYGLTPSRYLGIVFIIFEAVFILWFVLKRDLLKYILLLIAAVAFLMTFCPGSNALAVPKITQNLTLKRFISKDAADLSPKHRKRLYAAYDYLNNMDGGKDYLSKHYSDDQLASLTSGKDADDEYSYLSGSNTVYVNYECDGYTFDVSGYDTISLFECDFSDYDHGISVDRLDVDIKQMGNRYETLYDDERLMFDARKLAGLLMSEDYCDNQWEYESAPLIYDQSGMRYVITSARLSYDDAEGDLLMINIEGYLLR